jgi:hypothetical protein
MAAFRADLPGNIGSRHMSSQHQGNMSGHWNNMLRQVCCNMVATSRAQSSSSAVCSRALAVGLTGEHLHGKACSSTWGSVALLVPMYC